MMMKCESMEYVEHRYIYIYIKIFLSQLYIPSIQCKFCMYNIFPYYYKFNLIQDRHSPPRIRKIYIMYIKKDKI